MQQFASKSRLASHVVSLWNPGMPVRVPADTEKSGFLDQLSMNHREVDGCFQAGHDLDGVTSGICAGMRRLPYATSLVAWIYFKMLQCLCHRSNIISLPLGWRPSLLETKTQKRKKGLILPIPSQTARNFVVFLFFYLCRSDSCSQAWPTVKYVFPKHIILAHAHSSTFEKHCQDTELRTCKTYAKRTAGVKFLSC